MSSVKQNQVLVHFVNKAHTHTLMAFQEQVFKGKLKGYGGKVRLNESPKVAASREIEKETGVVKDKRRYHEDGGITVLSHNLILKGVITVYEVDGKDSILEEPACMLFCYWCDTYDGIAISTYEMHDPNWYPISNLPFHKMVDGDEHFIPLIFSDKSFIGDLVRSHDKKTFFYHKIDLCTPEELDVYTDK